jgi:DNA-directed RNA polymerase subunit alpha
MLELEGARIGVEEISEDGSYGKFVAAPFGRGYGVTLGNSLRRVLLSSIWGTAVSSIKIHGLLHEFAGIDGVSEDAIDIILNLKKLAIKNNNIRHENKIAYIDVKGAREVTAADIEVDSEIEIINKDLHIATLNSDDSQLSVELILSWGRGYKSAEQNKELNSTIGAIAIDSIYTPVKRVNFSVKDTRVGNMTDYDKLIMEIWTNGAISAHNALACAAQLMMGDLKSFVALSDIDNNIIRINESINPVSESVTESQVSIDRNKILDQPVEELEFSVRAFNCLKRAGIHTIGQLVEKTEEDMQKVRNLGRKSYEEIVTCLAKLGMKLKSNDV